MTAGCKKYIGASQFMGSSLVVLQHFRSQGRQSVVKTAGEGGQTRRGSGGRESPVGSRGRAPGGVCPWWGFGGEAPRS